MFEAYTGSKAGRRSALLIATALLLTGAIGVAGWQVHTARALGPPIAIPGTPLIVRVPLNWKRDPRKPSAFVLPTRGVPEQQIAEFERRISFHYERTAGFRPPLELLSRIPGISAAEPARIGPFAAVQVRQQEQRRWGIAQLILRLADLPNGDRVSVIYQPMSALTTADLELLDSICKAVKFDNPGLAAGWAKACRGAGIELAGDKSWRVTLPVVNEVPGLFVGGLVSGVPAWSLGIFRTWLAAGRRPADLLSDFAADYWLLTKVEVTQPKWKRADGTSIALVRHPDLAHNRRPIAAVTAVVRSPGEALLIFMYTDEHFVGPADEAMQRIARAVQFQPVAGIPEIDSAEKAGRDFAATLASAGAVPWWGELPVNLKYRGSTVRGEESVSVAREALSRNPVRGYRGSSVATEGQRYDEVTRWELARSGRYDFRTQTYVNDGQMLEVRETRGANDQPVKRLSSLNDAQRYRSAFRPGPAFVSPPLETLTESWVARESHTALIGEFSTLLAAGTHTRLLRPLAPENGFARVLVQRDFWPFGEILGFDDSGEMQFERSAAGEYRRIANHRF